MAEKHQNIPKSVSERTRRIMQLTQMVDDLDSDAEVASVDSYIGSDHCFTADHDSDPEIGIDDFSNSDSDDETPQVTSAVVQPSIYYGKKNCISWHSEAPHQSSKTQEKNIVKIKIAVPKGPASKLNNPSPEDIWRLYFTNDILHEIIVNTNQKLEEIRKNLKTPDSSSYRNTNKEEMEALFGLLILCSIFKSGREKLSSLFATDSTGRPIFRGIMSLKRCETLLLALRFDNSSTRSERKLNNPAAAIQNIFDIFISNCQAVYSIGAHACVDETLIPFRGRCPFRMYMPNKPAKYGIKLICLTDAHNSYLLNAYIYVGKDSDGKSLTKEEQKLLKPTQAVIRVTKPIINTNRNVTGDNWFSSIELVEELQKRKLTYVGTLKKNKKEIPPEFLPNRKKEPGSCIYGFRKNMTLLSFIPSKYKAVLLISSMHSSEFTDKNNDKPEVISFYNATKSGVDTLDYKCSIYSANRRTRRWPLAIFYHLISLSCANSHILHSCIQHTKMDRFDFMKALGLSLIKKHMETRLKIPNLSDQLKKIIRETISPGDMKEIDKKEKSDKLEKRRNCRYCPYTKNRMTNYKCVKCETPNCLECSKKICNVCVQNL